MAVVFPAPLCPNNATMLPSQISKFSPFTAGFDPFLKIYKSLQEIIIILVNTLISNLLTFVKFLILIPVA